MKKYDSALFLQELQQIDWKFILDFLSSDPSGLADTFQEIFESALDFHAPVEKKKVRGEFAPWLTPSLRKHMMTRNRLNKMAIKNPELWTAYPDSLIM